MLLDIRDHFVDPVDCRALLECAQTRRARGDFSPASIGGDGHRQRREDIRGDSTCWVAPPLFPAEKKLLTALESLRLEFNRTAFLGLLDLELQHAWYPQGAGYARHIDQPHGRAQRKLSLALYLNEGWSEGDGGELRIFEPEKQGEDDVHQDIPPLAGRLVCFLTEHQEHAVLPTVRGRSSISGWFRTRD